MTTTYIAITVDEENNAVTWWSELWDRYPTLAHSLVNADGVVIPEPLWDELSSLPGFSDGPEHAPDALLYHGEGSDGWFDVLGGKHYEFDTLR